MELISSDDIFLSLTVENNCLIHFKFNTAEKVRGISTASRRGLEALVLTYSKKRGSILRISLAKAKSNSRETHRI